MERKMTNEAIELARLSTLIEGQRSMLNTILQDAEKTRAAVAHMQRDIDALKRDVAEMKPITQQFSNIRMMALGMLTLLSIMGGTVFAIWQYAKTVILSG
jgi:hypothetical protein